MPEGKTTMRILVTEKLAPSGLEAMAAAGHDVDVQLDLSPEQLLAAVKGAHALVVRSATKVTADVLEAGRDLIVVGRAGVGIDNVDSQAATQRGVMVVNAPESNIVSAAEHAFALLLAQARNIPQAHGALVQGRWERSKWEGVELLGKTLGIVGLGRIGALIAHRAQAFGMRCIAYDPYITAERAALLDVERRTLDEVVAEADFLTIHLPKTKETAGLFNAALFKKAKSTLRIVNAARGGIIDEAALAAAISAGQIAGAALDVFDAEPTTESPLFALPSVVVTPHLGASTGEAQDKAGEQIVLALRGDFVPFAVNVAARGVSASARPYLGLAERLGRFFAAISTDLPTTIEVEYQGALSGEETSMLTLSALKGVFAQITDEPVSYVNAPRVAEEHGVVLTEVKTSASPDRVSIISVRSTSHSVSGTLVGGDAEKPQIIAVDGHDVEVAPTECMLIVSNHDRPGMIGRVCTIVGEAGVSIVNMAVGQTAGGGSAMMVLALDQPLNSKSVEEIRSTADILSVYQVGNL